jgi:hypothetical protein
VNNIRNAVIDKDCLMYNYLICSYISILNDEQADIFWCYSHLVYFIAANESHTCSSSFLSPQALISEISISHLVLIFHLEDCLAVLSVQLALS